MAGCGEGCAGSSPSAAGSAEPPEAETPEPAVEEPPPDPGPRPTLRVAGAPDAHSPSVAIRVENRGEALTELAVAIGLQRLSGDEWEDLGASMTLRDSCASPPPEACVPLAPGGVLLPPAWTGQLGDAQCECERCAAADPGTYRFVVQTCGGGHTLEGEPFELR